MDIQIRREARWAVVRHGVAAAIGYIAREHPEVPYQVVRNVVRQAARLAAQRQDRDIRPVDPREIQPRNLEVDFDNTMPKRGRVEYKADPSAYQQWSRSRYRDGKKRRCSVKQLVSSNVRRVDFLFKNVKLFNTNGAYWMDNKLDTANALSKYPCYLFAPFHVNQSAVGNVAQPMRRLYMHHASSSFNTVAQDGQDPTSGGSSSQLHIAQNGGGGAVSSIGPSATLAWTEFQLNLWGAKSKSVRYQFLFVRATSEDCNPYKWSSGSVCPDELQEQFREFMRPIMVNPICTSNNLAPSKWQVVKKYVFDIDPIDLQEGDNDPHCRTVRIFNRWNRNIRFDWTTNSLVSNAQQFLDPSKNVDEIVTDTVNVRPEELKDIFVIITATNYSSFVDHDPDNAHDASFDLSFRSSWRRI